MIVTALRLKAACRACVWVWELGLKYSRLLVCAFQNLDDDARATAVLDMDPDKANDHRAILERNFKIGEMIEKGELESGIYRGLGAYRHYVKRSEGALSRAKTTGLYGPVRGANNVRLTMYIDYKPEICKDYKETGYCGYGDCCKFLHDRTDYKEGWQVEKEWEELQKKKLVRPLRGVGAAVFTTLFVYLQVCAYMQK